MKILVIGGAGYIGGHVCKELLKHGHDITVYDNLATGFENNIQTGSVFVFGDIMDLAKLNSAMMGKEVVIHLAAFKAAGESMVDPEKFAANNITGTINVLNSMCQNGVKKIIFSSTAAVYGEPLFLPVTEGHPVNPINFYGFTKITVEHIIDWYSKIKNIDFVVLRYFNAVGYDTEGKKISKESNPQNLLPILMEAAKGVRQKFSIFGDDYKTKDGTCVRDYIHVKDLAIAHSKALDFLQKAGGNLTVNLASGTGLSVKEIIDQVRKSTGRDFLVDVLPCRVGDPAELYSDNKLAKTTLGWEPKYSDIKTIVESTWEIYNS